MLAFKENFIRLHRAAHRRAIAQLLFRRRLGFHLFDFVEQDLLAVAQIIHRQRRQAGAGFFLTAGAIQFLALLVKLLAILGQRSELALQCSTLLLR